MAKIFTVTKKNFMNFMALVVLIAPMPIAFTLFAPHSDKCGRQGCWWEPLAVLATGVASTAGALTFKLNEN